MSVTRNVQRLALALTISVLAGFQAYAEDLPTFQLVAKNGQFSPDVLAVPAGQRVKIVIANEGTDSVEFESTQLGREKALVPGATSFVVLNPLKSGTYSFFDDFHPETGKGQVVAQ